MGPERLAGALTAAGGGFDAVTAGGVSGGAVLRAVNRPETHDPKEPVSESPAVLGAGTLSAGTAPECSALEVSGATLFGAAK
jgi:hypothetical protein